MSGIEWEFETVGWLLAASLFILALGLGLLLAQRLTLLTSALILALYPIAIVLAWVGAGDSLTGLGDNYDSGNLVRDVARFGWIFVAAAEAGLWSGYALRSSIKWTKTKLQGTSQSLEQ